MIRIRSIVSSFQMSDTDMDLIYTVFLIVYHSKAITTTFPPPIGDMGKVSCKRKEKRGTEKNDPLDSNAQSHSRE